MTARAALALLCGGLAASCGSESPIPAEALRVDLASAVSAVEFGAPFELRLRLLHARSLEPAAFDPRRLAPLIVEERSRRVREDSSMREETIVLEARAFALEQVVIAPLAWTFFDRGTGTEQRAHTSELRIDVRSSLADGASREPELPFAPRERRSYWPWLIAAVALLAGASAFAWARRRPAQSAPTLRAPAPPAEPIEIALLRELAALELRAAEAEADRACAAELAREVARILRTGLEARSGLPASVRTREELAADSALRERLAEGELRALDAMLRRCDWVQFARAGLRSGEARELVRSARRFVAASGAADRAADGTAEDPASRERADAESRA